jgi:hypothetical protein
MKRLLIVTLALVLFAAVAHAQTTTTPGTTPTVTDPATGSFSKLSPGNQRIATAIFESQKVTTPPPPPTGGTGGTTTGTGTGTTVVTPPAPKNLTLDKIAYMKLHDKKGWGVIFKDLQKQGLVTEKNLGQAMKTYNEKRHVETASTTSGTSSIGRDFMNGSGPGSSGGNGMGQGKGSGGGGNSGHGGGNAYGRR